MEVYVTKDGIVIKAEDQTDAWALRGIFPCSETVEDWGKKIVIDTNLDNKEPPCNE